MHVCMVNTSNHLRSARDQTTSAGLPIKCLQYVTLLGVKTYRRFMHTSLLIVRHTRGHEHSDVAFVASFLHCRVYSIRSNSRAIQHLVQEPTGLLLPYPWRASSVVRLWFSQQLKGSGVCNTLRLSTHAVTLYIYLIHPWIIPYSLLIPYYALYHTSSTDLYSAGHVLSILRVRMANPTGCLALKHVLQKLYSYILKYGVAIGPAASSAKLYETTP